MCPLEGGAHRIHAKNFPRGERGGNARVLSAHVTRGVRLFIIPLSNRAQLTCRFDGIAKVMNFIPREIEIQITK